MVYDFVLGLYFRFELGMGTYNKKYNLLQEEMDPSDELAS